MITRIYADNFRCFQNLTVNLGELCLLMGGSGTGKSSLLVLVERLRRLLCTSADVATVFSDSDLCRWDTRKTMGFELDAELPDPLTPEDSNRLRFTYRLDIEFTSDFRKCRVHSEQLSVDGRRLFLVEDGAGQLFRDDYKEGPPLRFDWARSGLGAMAEREDNKRLWAFRRFVEDLLVVKPDVLHTGSESRAEERSLSSDGTNYAAWYRYLSTEHQDRVFDLLAQLREVLPGFQSCRLTQEGVTAKALRILIGGGGGPPIEYLFDELSEGERALFVLYTLLCGVPPGRHALFLDEPENYVALAEIQPWLMELNDACGETVPQAVLISHHPELLNYLGRERGILLTRDPNGPTRVHYGIADDDSGLDVAERVARGWVDE